MTVLQLVRYLIILGFSILIVWMLNSPKAKCQYKVLKDSLIEVTSCKIKLPESELKKYIWYDDCKGSQHKYD